MIDLDPALLRTLIAFADSGSLARAAAIVGRTPSAVTAQVQRLEDIAGTPLLQAAGRGRALTDAGERLVGHARRLIALQDEAMASLNRESHTQRIGIGTTQDFTDSGLPRLLRLFAMSHARVRIDLRVGRSAELSETFREGGIDVMIAMRTGEAKDEVSVIREEVIWLAAADGLVSPGDEMPVALLDPPCRFRDAAISALESAGRRHRLAATSASLSGLRAAVVAGLAVTARTRRWISPGIEPAPRHLELPPLGTLEFAIRVRPQAHESVRRLAALLAEGLANHA